MGERITFMAGSIRLEGLLTRGTCDRGVVVAHPHPLYGGDMYNPVVETVGDAFAESGYTVLRFNFRGVGQSEGSYDDGEGESRDIDAAMAYLAAAGLSRIDLAGYSFGAWVAALHRGQQAGGSNPPAKGPTADGAADLLLVSPPVGLLDFAAVKKLPGLSLVVTGALDEQIAPGRMIGPMVFGWNRSADFEEIVGADHFYSGCLVQLKEMIASYLESQEG